MQGPANERHCDPRWFQAPLPAEPAHRSLGAIVFKADGQSRDRWLRLAKPHTNRHGPIHGGLIATLADIAMGYSCGYQLGAAYMVTIGQWITSAVRRSDNGSPSSRT